MNRLPLLLALSSLAFAACGDDAPSDDADDREGAAVDDTQRDAAQPGAEVASDAKTAAPLDANLGAEAAVEQGDASDAVGDAAQSAADASSFDATTQDATASESDASMCVALGADCQQGACCEGSTCAVTTEAPTPICVRNCETNDECESGCCASGSGSAAQKVCSPVEACEQMQDPNAPLRGIYCINDPKVFSWNREYMGLATADTFEDESVCKYSGPYGQSKFDSVLNITSNAYDLSLGFAPKISCDEYGTPFAYISKYKGASPIRVIDPDILCTVLKNSNL